MENKVVTVISRAEGCDLLLEFYGIWFASRNIKDILIEDKHLNLPSFKKCLNNSSMLNLHLSQKEVFDFIKDKLECEEVILQDDDNKILITNQEQVIEDEEEDDDDEWEDVDEDEDEEDE
jgi:hypothetical protein